MRSEHAWQVQLTDYQLPGYFTSSDQEETFAIKELRERPYEQDDKIHVSISIEMDLDRYIVKWNTYTVLDWLSDIGGLYIAAAVVLAFIMSLIKVNSLDNFIVSQIYK